MLSVLLLKEKSRDLQAEVQVPGIKRKRLQDPPDNPVSISLFSVLHPIYTRTSLNHRRGLGGGEGGGSGAPDLKDNNFTDVSAPGRVRISL